MLNCGEQEKTNDRYGKEGEHSSANPSFNRVQLPRHIASPRIAIFGIFRTFSCLCGAVRAITSEMFQGAVLWPKRRFAFLPPHVGLASWLPVSAAGISLGINPQPELARHDWGNRDGSN